MMELINRNKQKIVENRPRPYELKNLPKVSHETVEETDIFRGDWKY